MLTNPPDYFIHSQDLTPSLSAEELLSADLHLALALYVSTDLEWDLEPAHWRTHSEMTRNY